MKNIKKEIEELSKKIQYHQNLYYKNAKPEISDREYDLLFDKLLELERKYPEFSDKNSPTKRIGSDLDNNFPEKEHKIPVLSLDKEYSIDGIINWIVKNKKNANQEIGFIIEEKLDGASIVLYYEKGDLKEALTRGDGKKGNLVTENIRTVKNIPLKLSKQVNLAVRGEIFIEKESFLIYNKRFDNKYSNPRNLASGSLRQLKSSLVSQVPLKMVAYEGYFEDSFIEKNKKLNQHIYNLIELKELGFNIGNKPMFISDNEKLLKELSHYSNILKTDRINTISAYIKEKIDEREVLTYDIDGLVIKINELKIRERLGYTAHHPRWAIAFKFESPLAETNLLAISIQVGRNGRVTPVAELKPVQIAGSIVSRATLHNAEYIDILELGIGDRVSISKRGDIIPAVEEVVEKNPEGYTKFIFPDKCPFCSSKLFKDGAHHFCKNEECPERKKRTIIYFASKDQMNIESLGEKTINFLYDNNYIKEIPDLYGIDFERLLQEEGFKDKKIDNIKKSLEKSKEKPFPVVLAALGLDGIGLNRAIDFVTKGLDSIDKFIEIARNNDTEKLIEIDGVGEILAKSIISQFKESKRLEQIDKLKEIGLNFKFKNENNGNNKINDDFSRQIWVITGSFDSFKPRSKAADEIKKRGGKVAAAVSKSTTHLLKGDSPGSKADKAKELNIKIVDEDEFKIMLKKEEKQ